MSCKLKSLVVFLKFITDLLLLRNFGNIIIIIIKIFKEGGPSAAAVFVVVVYFILLFTLYSRGPPFK